MWKRNGIMNVIKTNKVQHVDGIVDAFISQYRIHGNLMINYMITQNRASRQQLNAGSQINKTEYGFKAIAGSNAYVRISARSCEESMGAGGTTETNRRARIVNDLRAFFVWVLMELLTE